MLLLGLLGLGLSSCTGGAPGSFWHYGEDGQPTKW